MEETIISKMSVKAIGCKPTRAANATDPVPLCRVLGKASGLKHGENKNDGSVWTALTGDFLGINLEDNKVYRSGKLFLPSGIQESVEGPLAVAESNDKQIVVQFAFEIRSIAAKNPIGYSYQAVSLVPPSEEDELNELRRAVDVYAQRQIGPGTAGVIAGGAVEDVLQKTPLPDKPKARK